MTIFHARGYYHTRLVYMVEIHTLLPSTVLSIASHHIFSGANLTPSSHPLPAKKHKVFEMERERDLNISPKRSRGDIKSFR